MRSALSLSLSQPGTQVALPLLPGTCHGVSCLQPRRTRRSDFSFPKMRRISSIDRTVSRLGEFPNKPVNVTGGGERTSSRTSAAERVSYGRSVSAESTARPLRTWATSSSQGRAVGKRPHSSFAALEMRDLLSGGFIALRTTICRSANHPASPSAAARRYRTARRAHTPR